MKLFKDGMEKDVSNVDNIALLKEMGWISEQLDGDIEALRAEARELGLTVHPKTGAIKLQQKIDEYKLEQAKE